MDEYEDKVNHPAHYNSHPSGVEVIEITEHLNFCLGNAVKYVLRADLKGDPLTDLHKAVWYLNREIARREVELHESTMDALFDQAPRVKVLLDMGVRVKESLVDQRDGQGSE